MQTPPLPALTNFNAPAAPNKLQQSSDGAPAFGQLLQRQISQRDGGKPVDAPKPEVQQQATKTPVNSANTNADANAQADKDQPAAASSADTTPASSAASDSKTASANADTAAIKKAQAASDDKKTVDPTDAALNASAAIMALVGDTKSAMTNSTSDTAASSRATTATALDSTRLASTTAAYDLAATATASQTAESTTVGAAVARAGKADTDADAFSAAFQTAGKTSETQALQSTLPELSRIGTSTSPGASASELAQVVPQQALPTFEMIAPTGPHPGDVLAPRIGNDSWNQALGERMVWMVAGSEQTASLTLNPPDLGPMQVVLHVSNGHADASFFAAQPEVRQALEAALPKLREMLSEAGVSLGQANVSAGQPQQQQAAERRFNGSGAGGAGTVDAVGTKTASRIVGGNGLVDTFA